MPWGNSKKLAGIQYAGEEGITQDCINAIARLIQCDVRIGSARILTFQNSHGLLVTVDHGDLLAIKGGFASGYPGEGPHGFSYVLSLLDAHEVDIEEIRVSGQLMDRLNSSALTLKDLAAIESSRPVRPTNLYEYINEKHDSDAEKGLLWRTFRPVIPYAIIDPRIIDLARSFWTDPDDRLMTGFRRLEDTVRRRTGIQEHGSKLFSQAFAKDGGKLGWENLEASEQIGRMNIFTSVYMAYRNPRAHQEQTDKADHDLSEFLLLNHLYSLEADAVVR